MSASDVQGNRGGIGVWLAFLAIVVVGLVAFALLGNGRQQLKASPTGFDGLERWLSAEGIGVRSFDGNWWIEADTVGLAIVPIYDTRPDADRSVPETQDELILQEDENDILLDSIRRRSALVQVLAVLPKWRSGMRLTGQAHPDMLVDTRATSALLRRLTSGPVSAIRQGREAFETFPYRAATGETLSATIYLPQTFDGKGCEPIVGAPGRMILARCPSDRGSSDDILILSDPDLLNNHGLRLGDNAKIAADLLALLTAADQNVGTDVGGTDETWPQDILIDYARVNRILRPQDPISREREWSDLAALFAPPYSMLWIGALAVLLLVLWRGGVRFGPALAPETARQGSKDRAIDARARLMRMTGQDGALIVDYSRARVDATALRLLGPSPVGAPSARDALIAHAARHDPALAEALDEILAHIGDLPATISRSETVALITDLEDILKDIGNGT